MCGLVGCSSSVVCASGDVQVNGFITQGFFLTDDNNFYGESEAGSADFHEIAVNGVWKPATDLSFAAQVMKRTTGKIQNDTRLDYGLVDYRFDDTHESRHGIRLGRVKTPYGFYNETRDVAFTRPSILLPQSVYFEIARDLQLSSDGFAYYSSYNLNSGWLDFDLVYGKPTAGQSVEYAYLSSDWPGEISGEDGLMGRAMYTTGDQRWKLSATAGRFRLSFDANEAALALTPVSYQALAPQDGQLEIEAYLLSAQYNTEKWSFTSEVSRQVTEWGSLQGGFASTPVVKGIAGYLQAEYRYSPSVDFVLRHSRLHFDETDKFGKNTLSMKPAHTQYSIDSMMGIGWRPTPSWLLRAEWHVMEGTGWVPEQDNPDSNALEKHWNLLALQATYRF